MITDETGEQAAERRTLRRVLAVNAVQVVGAGAMGIVAESTGLLGAALDNLGDTASYLVSLYAVGRGEVAKARAARVSGVLLIALALGLAGEVVRRFLTGAEPIGLLMIVTAIANAAVNMINLRLLRSRRDRGVHLKASWIFTTNDMLANLGIAASGIAVAIFRSPVPDLLIGLVVAGVVVKGGIDILAEARKGLR
ncbi:MAG: cation transporter [Myxococcota bacterium]